ncbi:MAG TPA: hypothetical protein VGK74_02780 [Symbiobacteriaceae bacterium]|jgi:hypothetical protein
MGARPKRLAGPVALGNNVYGTVYTANAAGLVYAEVLSVTLCNTTAAALTGYIHLCAAGAEAAGNAYMYNYSLDVPGLPYTFPLKIVLEPNEILRAKGSATGITIALGGLEVT